MVVDGKQIARAVLEESAVAVRSLSRLPRLTVLTAAPNFETQKFLSVKKKKAELLGVAMNIIELTPELTTEDCVQAIQKASEDADGIVVQLPFPAHIDQRALMGAIPPAHDVDAFNLKDDEVLPPVVGAIREIAERHDVPIFGQKCVVVGEGDLVGRPAANWFREQGAVVMQLTKESGDIRAETTDAEIVVLGAGAPGLLKPDMIKDGVAIFDAGTSETAGKLTGDADPACAEKASVFTPVPGGIGPITVAVLLKNLVMLTLRHGADPRR